MPLSTPDESQPSSSSVRQQTSGRSRASRRARAPRGRPDRRRRGRPVRTGDRPRARRPCLDLRSACQRQRRRPRAACHCAAPLQLQGSLKHRNASAMARALHRSRSRGGWSWFAPKRTRDLSGGRHGPIRISGACFLLRDGSAARFVRGVPVAPVVQRLFADAARRVFRRRRAGIDWRAPVELACFCLSRQPVADAYWFW